jgi:DNA-binding protein
MTENAANSEKEAAVQPKPRAPIPADTIFVGNKPIMSYATAVMMHFQGDKKILTLKARGRAISTAVDVVEVVRRRFFEGKLKVIDIAIGTDAIGEGGDVRNVSTIEIKVEKTE